MKTYIVQPGRSRALGRKAKPGDVVGPVSDIEAEYDLIQGNIAPAPAATAVEKAEAKAPKSSGTIRERD